MEYATYAMAFDRNWMLLLSIGINDRDKLKDDVKLLLYLKENLPRTHSVEDIWRIIIVSSPIRGIKAKEIDELLNDPRIKGE